MWSFSYDVGGSPLQRRLQGFVGLLGGSLHYRIIHFFEVCTRARLRVLEEEEFLGLGILVHPV